MKNLNVTEYFYIDEINSLSHSCGDGTHICLFFNLSSYPFGYHTKTLLKTIPVRKGDCFETGDDFFIFENKNGFIENFEHRVIVFFETDEFAVDYRSAGSEFRNSNINVVFHNENCEMQTLREYDRILHRTKTKDVEIVLEEVEYLKKFVVTLGNNTVMKTEFDEFDVYHFEYDMNGGYGRVDENSNGFVLHRKDPNLKTVLQLFNDISLKIRNDRYICGFARNAWNTRRAFAFLTDGMPRRSWI